jgi:CheY-like chemotaxis protein
MPHTTSIEHTILIIIDDFSMRRGISFMLQELGYRVVEADEGRRAMELMRVHAADLVLLDLLLPGMDALDILGELRRLDPGPAILLFTAFAEHPRMRDVRTTCSEQIITIPDLSLLPMRLAELLDTSEAHEQ